MILAGVVVFASSWLLGGVVFAAVMDLLALLDAPDDQQFLPADQPEAGGQILQHLGGTLIACGVCIATIRLVAELLGLAGRPGLTGKLDPADKLGLGAAGIGTLTIVSTGLSQNILYEVFLYDYGRGAAMVTLETVGRVGAVSLIGGLAVLILRRPRYRRVLLGWADRVGWGKMGCGRINKLGLGAIVLALIWRNSDARVRERIRHSSRSRDWHSCCGNRSPHSCGRAALERGELSSSRRESASAES